MKNKYWFLMPLAIIIIVVLLIALCALIDGNIWLFSEFFVLETYSWWQIICAISVAISDLVIGYFLIKKSSELAGPDFYEDDDDLE